MKKILFTVSALFIGTIAFSQAKKDVTLEKAPVQDPKKTPVRVVSTNKESVKKAEPVKKEATRKETTANPPREEKEVKKK